MCTKAQQLCCRTQPWGCTLAARVKVLVEQP